MQGSLVVEVLRVKELDTARVGNFELSYLLIRLLKETYCRGGQTNAAHTRPSLTSTIPWWTVGDHYIISVTVCGVDRWLH